MDSDGTFSMNQVAKQIEWESATYLPIFEAKKKESTMNNMSDFARMDALTL